MVPLSKVLATLKPAQTKPSRTLHQPTPLHPPPCDNTDHKQTDQQPSAAPESRRFLLMATCLPAGGGSNVDSATRVRTGPSEGLFGLLEQTVTKRFKGRPYGRKTSWSVFRRDSCKLRLCACEEHFTLSNMQMLN